MPFAQKSFPSVDLGKQGEDLGTFFPEQRVKKFDEVVFSDEVGTVLVLDPVKTRFGQHLIEVTRRT